MSYNLQRTLSFGGLRSYIVRALAALEAAGFTDLAALWRAQREKVRTAEAAYIADEEHEAVTTAKVRVSDEAWDSSVAMLAREALYLSDGKADKDPYAALFTTAKARDLQGLGPAKATVAAQALISKIESLDEPRLAPFALDLLAKTEALKVAETNDAEAELKLASHAIERTRLLRQTETLIAETEAKILALRPGSDELVRAILSPNLARRPTRRQEPAETPQTPEQDETP